MRTARWAAAAAAITIGVLAGCSGIDTTTGRADGGDDTEASQPAEAEPVATEDQATEEPSTPATTEPEPPAPAPEPGTRQNPAVVGTDVGTFSSGDESVEVTLGAATWDANSIVSGQNQFNDPPGDGMVYVILPVTSSYSGPESMLPWIDLEITYLAENGRSYDEAFSVIPDDLSEVSDIYDGGTATGNVLFELPADQLPGGLWGVSYNWSDQLWWAAS